ncbi:MAG: hypothetical protein RL318_2437 [Fibrobacterota bacterium]|jgi:hypothetical protein
MLATLLTTLVGASTLGDFLPTLTPVSFDPAPRNESHVMVDSVFNGARAEVANSKITQIVASKDVVTGRPLAMKVITSVAGVADTSSLSYTWLTPQVFKTLQTGIKYGAMNVPLSLTSSATSASAGVTTQDLSGNLLGTTFAVSRDSITWNAKGFPLYAKVMTADMATLSAYVLQGKNPPLLDSRRSITRFAPDDTTPVFRLNESYVGGAWKVVDSSTVTLVDGRPSILTVWDSTGTTMRDSLVWKDGRLVNRYRAGQIVGFAYDAGGRIQTRSVNALSGAPIAWTTWQYDGALSIARPVASQILSIQSSSSNRSAVLRLEKSAMVRVSVHAVDGRLIGLLADGQLPAGVSSFSLNGIRGAAIVKVRGADFSATASIPSR